MYPEITYFSDDNLKKNHKIFEKHIEFFSLNTKIKFYNIVSLSTYPFNETSPIYSILDKSCQILNTYIKNSQLLLSKQKKNLKVERANCFSEAKLGQYC
jgi:hypothetical protein